MNNVGRFVGSHSPLDQHWQHFLQESHTKLKVRITTRQNTRLKSPFTGFPSRGTAYPLEISDCNK